MGRTKRQQRQPAVEHDGISVRMVRLLVTALGAAISVLAYYVMIFRGRIDVATPEALHTDQRFDMEGLRTFNAYEPRQLTMNQQRQQHSRNHTIPEDARLTIVSWEPRIVVVDRFVSEKEANELLAVAGSLEFSKMGVIRKDGTSGFVESTATSTITDFPQGHPLVRGLRSRLSQLTSLPLEWYEPLKALNYSEGAYFRGHLDAHPHAHQRSVSRVATAIVYLNDVAQGGETYFPLAINHASGQGDRIPSTCDGYGGKDASRQSEEARAAYEDGSELEGADALSEDAGALGVTVRPQKGRAVLWWNRDADGSLALRSRHVGCPVVRGRKLVATQWMHHRPLPCDDEAAYGESQCKAWAAAGECTSNPSFMRASCGRSCGLCEQR